MKKAPQGAFLLGEGQVLARWLIAVTALGDCPIKRGKANIATTMFARSRLPRSLLTAHSVAAEVGFVGDWDGCFERFAARQNVGDGKF